MFHLIGHGLFVVFRKPGHSGVETTLDGSQRDADHLSDILVGKSVVVGQDEGLAEFVRHLLDNVAYDSAFFVQQQFFIRRCAFAGEEMNVSLCALGIVTDLSVKRDLPAANAAANVVARLIGCNREEPGLESPRRVETIPGPVDLEEGFLDDVLSRHRITGEPHDKLVQLRGMSPDEQFEAGWITKQELSKQCLIRWRFHGPIVSLRRREVTVQKAPRGTARAGRRIPLGDLSVDRSQCGWRPFSATIRRVWVRSDHREWVKVGVVTALGGLMILSTAGAAGSPQARHAGGHGLPIVTLAHPRVVILKSKRVLHLFDAQRLIRSYPVDLGRMPTGQKRLIGDDRTPLGRFRVVTKNPMSPYHRFLGIDYPDSRAAREGLAFGLISPGEAINIQRAIESGGRPAWSTALGGAVGIHGRRIGEDWTGGCIALANDHVEELFAVLRLGDPIEILP